MTLICQGQSNRGLSQSK